MERAKAADQPRQSDKFITAARDAGADVDTSAADALMSRLAKTPPEPKKSPAIKDHALNNTGERK